MEVELAVLVSPSLIVRTVSVEESDMNTSKEQSCVKVVVDPNSGSHGLCGRIATLKN